MSNRVTWPLALAAALSFATATAFAHVVVSPGASVVGITESYGLRVHNETKVPTASLDLDVPEGITVLEVAAVEDGSYEVVKAGDRITHVIWKVAVPPNTYKEFKFSAKNPDTETEVHWPVKQNMSDGSVIDWSDKADAKDKASMTKIRAAVP